MADRSKVLKFHRFRWSGVEVRDYKSDERDRFKDVTRQSLLGEREDEAALSVVTRYFEVQPGGYSSLEYHEHPHTVVIIRGSGQVVLGDETHAINPFDCIYVAPNTVHQFRATGDKPLGFVCVVDRVRDRPKGAN
jgi:quercetin dioxygenase-like cupin family protein